MGCVVCAGLLLLLTGCTASVDASREAYARTPRAGPVAQRDAFRILGEWSWPATVAVESAAASAAAPPARMPGPAGARVALADGRLGLLPAERFRIDTGACTECPVPAPVLSWFREEVIAVPAPESMSALPAAAGTEPRSPASTTTGVANPAARQGILVPDGGSPAVPPLIWIGAPEILPQARLSADARTVTAAGTAFRLALTPRIPSNREYVDASTARFFAGRPLRLRGVSTPGRGRPNFVARTIWPQDERLEPDALNVEPLRDHESLGTLIEAQGASQDRGFPGRLLYERDAPYAQDAPYERDVPYEQDVPRSPAERSWAGRPVVAFVLTGAQSDDDGAGSGHLAVATGVIGPDGEWADWLVANFYPLEEISAKGIVPSMLPMDNYLLDLNSGQLYYRPGYMLVAVLRRPAAALAVHDALQQQMVDLHCGHARFDLERNNSTAMTVDSLRAIGWRIPTVGPTSRLAGVAAAPWVALFNRNLKAGRDVRAALSAERTRLLPRVAFEVAGHDLLALTGAPPGDAADLTPFERALARDVEALLFVRLPQVPSSRSFGTFPVRSLLAYGARLLSDPYGYDSAPAAGTRTIPNDTEGCAFPGADDEASN